MTKKICNQAKSHLVPLFSLVAIKPFENQCLQDLRKDLKAYLDAVAAAQDNFADTQLLDDDPDTLAAVDTLVSTGSNFFDNMFANVEAKKKGFDDLAREIENDLDALDKSDAFSKDFLHLNSSWIETEGLVSDLLNKAKNALLASQNSLIRNNFETGMEQITGSIHAVKQSVIVCSENCVTYMNFHQGTLAYTFPASRRRHFLDVAKPLPQPSEYFRDFQHCVNKFSDTCVQIHKEIEVRGVLCSQGDNALKAWAKAVCEAARATVLDVCNKANATELSRAPNSGVGDQTSVVLEGMRSCLADLDGLTQQGGEGELSPFLEPKEILQSSCDRLTSFSSGRQDPLSTSPPPSVHQDALKLYCV